MNFEYEPLPIKEDSPIVLLAEPMRLMGVSGSGGIHLKFTYNEQGLLMRAQRGLRGESYEYEQEIKDLSQDYNLVGATDSNSHSFHYEYYKDGDVNYSLSTFIKALKARDMIKQVGYPDGHSANFHYDAVTENKRIVTDLRGRGTTYILNVYGNPTTIVEPEGKTTGMSWSIDAGGNDNETIMS
jgi:hypothetical protein